MRLGLAPPHFYRRLITAAVTWVVVVAALALPMSPADAVPDETYADDFDSYSFSGSTGGASWEGPWLEVGESDGVAAGTIQVGDEPNCRSEPCLVVGRSPGPDAWVEREVDLSGYASANLSFDYKVHWHAPGGGTGELSVSDDGGGNWFTLDSWPLGTTTGDLVGSYDLTPYLAPDTMIRFGATDSSSDSHINIDNLVITASGRQGYFDEFADLAWDGSDGSIAWNPDPWQDSGGNGPTSGLIQAIANSYCASGNCLRIEGSSASASHSVVREVDLSGATFASLLFNYRRDNYNTCSIRLEVSDNGGGSWNHITTYTANGGDASQQSAAHDITAYTAPDSQIRFISNGTCTSGEFFFADNIWVYTDAVVSSNQSPVFDQDLLDRSDPEGTLTNVDSPASDPDSGDTLTYSAVGLPEGLSIDPASGTISGAPSPNAAGVHAVTITVTDDGTPSRQDTDTFTWTVTAGKNLYLVAGTGGGAGGNDLLTAVDPADFDSSTNEISIGSGTGTDRIYAAAIDPWSGTIYAANNAQMGIIDPTTGVFAALPSTFGSGDGSIGHVTFSDVTGLVFSPGNGYLYACHDDGAGSVLYRVNPVTGAVIPGAFGGDDYILIQPQQSGLYVNATDLAFHPTTGVLYSVLTNHSNRWRLVTVDPATGDTTAIGETVDWIRGLAFDQSGQLWGTTAGAGSESLYEISLSDGAATNPRPIDNGANYESIAFALEPMSDTTSTFYLVATNGGGAGGDDLLTRFDPSDFDPTSNETDIGSGLGTTAAEGAAFDPSSGLLYLAVGDRIGIADTLAGTYSPRPSTVGVGDGAQGSVTFSSVVALAFQPSTGHLYAVVQRGSQEDLLVRVDPATGAHVPGAFGGDDYVPIGSLPSSSMWNQGLAFDPTTGLLYGVSANLFASTLVTIDPASGATTAVGSTEHPTYGLSFDESGQLWGVKSLFGDDEVHEIDKATGAATNPRDVDNGSYYRAIAISGEPVPNQPPVFDQNLPDRTDSEGALISIDSPATDPNLGDNLTYSATGLPEGVSIDPATGTITGVLSASSSGSHAVLVTVSDSGSPTETDTDAFTWTVTPGEPTYLVAAEGGGSGNDALLTAVDRSDSDPATNEATIGSGLGRTNTEGAAIEPGSNTLFGSHGDQIGTIDVSTGTFSALPSVAGTGNGAAGLETFDDIEALSFHPASGDLYAIHRTGPGSSESMLLRIDPATGAHEPGVFGGDDYVVVQPQGSHYHGPGMAHDPTDGTLYFIHRDDIGADNWNLATLNPTTGATNTIGAVPDYLTGLSFDESGNLYGITDEVSGGTLYQIDKANGSVNSSITVDNTNEYEAIAIAYPAAPNQRPIFDRDLLDRTDAEGAAISLSAAATDPDLHGLVYTATGLPSGLSIDPGTGLISGTIDFAASAASPFNTIITVVDDGIPNLSAADTFTWTVTESNRVPVFDQDLLDRSDAEGTVVSLSASATDPDAGDVVTYGVSGLPPGLSFDVFSGLISGTIDYTAATGSPYAVTISATDDRIPPGNATPDTFTWIITNTNQPPVVVNPGPQTTPELTPFSIVVTASDPDGTIPNLTDSGTLPAWATLTDNLDGTATIAGIPGIGDAGTSTVTVTGSDGTLTDDAVFDITVTNTNVAPTIVDPGNQTGNEGSPFTVTVTASDPDGTTVSFADSGTLPAWATLTDNGDDTATISGTPGYDDAGTTTVTITASDGSLTDDAVFDIIISNTNRSPVVAPIADQVTAENVGLTPIAVSASDPDGTVPSLSAPSLPAWASLIDNGDGTGTITGTPGYDDEVITNVTVLAYDGSLIGTTSFDLTVTNTNRAPILAAIGDQTVAEGSALPAVTATASDPDGTLVSLAASGLPSWASFVDNGDGTGTITGTPGYDDAGVSTVTIYAEDGGTPNLSDTTTFDITVTNINRAPVLNPIGDQTVAEGSALTPVTATAIDPDGTAAALTATGLPAWVGFVDNGDGTGTITGTPGYDDAGVSTVTIYAEDGGTPNLSDTTTFDITVTNTNRAPVLSPIPDQTVLEATALTPVVITAVDPDGTTPSLSATGLPSWAGFADNGDGTGTISGTPGPTDAGVSTVTVTATDGSLFDTKTFDITVTQGNLPPAFGNILPDRTDAEGTSVAIDAGATDPDGDTVTYYGAGLPPGVTLDPTTGQITGTLTYAAAGVYSVTITAADNGTPVLEASQSFVWTVANTNRKPSLTQPPPLLVAEETQLTFTAEASDPDGDGITFTLAGAPPGAAIDPHSGVFSWTPAEVHGVGSFAVTVVATDTGTPAMTDTKTVAITVTEVNRPPTISHVSDQHNQVGDTVSLLVVAEDPDIPVNTVSYSASGLPPGLEINPANGLIKGTILAWANGQYSVAVSVSDDGSPSRTAVTTFKWMIGDTNHPPSLERLADLTVSELTSATFTAAASDRDGDRVTFSLSSEPSGSTIDPSTGVFRWVPSEAQGPATYRVTVIATDDGSPRLSASKTVNITVNEENRAPTLEPVADQTDDAATTVSLAIEAADVDLPANTLEYSASGLPPGLSIDPNTGLIRGEIIGETVGLVQYEVTVSVTDDGAPPLVATTAFTWSVVTPEIEPDNLPPRVDPIADLYTDAGTEVTFAIGASDDEPLTFAATGLPPGTSLDAATGAISGRVASDAVGSHSVAITVTERSEDGLSTTVAFTWVVTDRAAAEQKDEVVVALVDDPPVDVATPEESSRPIRRGLVVMSSAAAATTESMRLPLALLLALMVGFITVGRIGLYPLLWRGDRHVGTISFYDPELSFGLIAPDEGGEPVFVHAHAFPRRQRATLATGMRLRYRVLAGDNRASAWGATTEVGNG